jgi:vacuole morphology and inheritance protein 14
MPCARYGNKSNVKLNFTDVSKLAADSELSVKNGAELLDRLIKDIVAESASNYVSILQDPEHHTQLENKSEQPRDDEPRMAFSLANFMPLLQDRITVLNPYTRMFLVSWITLLDSIPDLELVSYMPAFLGGLFKFLSDSNQDVHTATHVALEKFLSEIRKIARVKHGLVESQRGRPGYRKKQMNSDSDNETPTDSETGSAHDHTETDGEGSDDDSEESMSEDEHGSGDGEEDWIPGQDVHVDYSKILEIMVAFLGGSSGQFLALSSFKPILTS